MVATYSTSDRQPLQRGCDVGRILRYCQTRNRSNTPRDTFRYADYAFVLNETVVPPPARRSISTTGQPSPTAATMIDMRHGPLPAPDEAKWQLDFLARWKYLVYSEGAIELDGHPVLKPEGRFSKEQIWRINTAILNRVPESGCAETPAPRPEAAAMEIGGKVIEQIA